MWGPSLMQDHQPILTDTVTQKFKKLIPSYSQCILSIIPTETELDPVGLLGTKAFLCPLLWVPNGRFSSVQFSRSVVSDSLSPHEPQHSRSPCPSPTAGVYPNPCPLSQWRYPTISSSVIPFSSWAQSFPASGSFQMSQLFTSGGQSFGVSASTSVLPVDTQDWSPLGWTGWISL